MKIKSLLRTTFTGLASLAITLSAAAPAQATQDPALWCWSMQNGTIKGTFSMSPNTPGDGTAPAATYTITGFTLYETAFPSDVLTGSIADGTYKFGTQPLYQIIWSGTSPTTWKRDNGTYTNGLGMYSNVIPAKADLVFETNFQEGYIDTVSIFSSSITPTLSPAPASGLCPGQVAPTPSPSPSTTPSQQSQPLAETGIATAPFFAGFAALVLGIGAMLFARKRSQ